jgi:hypothetical protein
LCGVANCGLYLGELVARLYVVVRFDFGVLLWHDEQQYRTQ